MQGALNFQQRNLSRFDGQAFATSFAKIDYFDFHHENYGSGGFRGSEKVVTQLWIQRVFSMLSQIFDLAQSPILKF